MKHMMKSVMKLSEIEQQLLTAAIRSDITLIGHILRLVRDEQVAFVNKYILDEVFVNMIAYGQTNPHASVETIKMFIDKFGLQLSPAAIALGYVLSGKRSRPAAA